MHYPNDVCLSMKTMKNNDHLFFIDYSADPFAIEEIESFFQTVSTLFDSFVADIRVSHRLFSAAFFYS